MKAKNFLVSGITGGIVNFLLGWIFYAQLFPNIYPIEGNLMFVFLGCITFGLFIAYVFTGIGSITSSIEGLKAGAAFGFFYGLSLNLFMNSSIEPNYQNMGIDVGINLVCAAIVGAVIAMINGKMK